MKPAGGDPVPGPAAGGVPDEGRLPRGARQEYAVRLAARRATVAALERRHRRISWARLAVFFLAGGMAWMAWGAAWISPWGLVVPVGLFGVLLSVHNRVLRRRDRARRAVSFYEAAIARLDDRWAGTGRAGSRFLDDDHPYAGDLDLFGKGTLFELLCTARTAAGEETLARWLCAAATPATIRDRQAAVEELRTEIDLREDLAVVGGGVAEAIHPEVLVRWCQAPAALPVARLTLPATIITSATVASVAAHVAGWFPALVMVPPLVAQMGLAGLCRRRVRRVVAEVERPARELALLEAVVARLERQPFTSSRLVALRRSLDTAGRSPSGQVRRLTRIVHALDWRRNTFFAPLAALLMWTTHIGLAIERWRALVGPRVASWLQTVGEIEALGALGGYAYDNPADPFPELLDVEEPCFIGEALGHPLLPDRDCVRNDVTLDAGQRLLVVSGSNMSGKTTLLRTVGINAVLAQCGAPVRAGRLRMTPLVVGASIRLNDSIQAGRSRFYAEILRIRQIVGLAAGPGTLLFLLDEILHGTNSHDRRIGAEAIVRGLLGRGAVGLVTTHDLALARITEDGAVPGVNVHFEDQIVDGRMQFDYRMRSGVVRKSNALALMRSIGLEV
ncbi:MAG: DNA mismatch repair protein MutS [Acidobacteriota bacterium]